MCQLKSKKKYFIYSDIFMVVYGITTFIFRKNKRQDMSSEGFSP